MQEIQIQEDSTPEILNALVKIHGNTIRFEKIPQDFWVEALQGAMEYENSKLNLKNPVIGVSGCELILEDDFGEIWKLDDNGQFIQIMFCNECGREDFINYFITDFPEEFECKGCREIAEWAW